MGVEMNKKIIIRGGYGLSNFGDDALMVTIYNHISQITNQSKITLLCKKVGYIEKLLPEAKVINYNKIKDSSLNGCSTLVYGGGTQFYSFERKKENKITKLFLYPRKTLNNLVVKIRKKIWGSKYIENKFAIAEHFDNIILIGIGLGPFQASNSRIEEKTKLLLNRARYVSVRDEFALNKCEEWGVPNYTYTPDICYSFKSPFLETYKNASNAVRKIGVIVRDWAHDEKGEQYYTTLCKSVELLRAEGFDVKFIIFDQDSDLFWLKLLKKQESSFLAWNPNKHSIDGFLEELSNFDLFITARFHGAVFASLLGKPFITVEVEQKLRMIHESFPQGSACWKQGFDTTELLEFVKDMDEKYLQYKNGLAEKANELIKQSDNNFGQLAEKIN